MPKAHCANHHHQEDNLLKEAPVTTCSDKNSKQVLRKLFYVFLLATLIMSVEITGGILSGSISILSDAAHMLSDVLGFVISMVSVWISTLPADSQYSYGYHRASVIGALASTFVIWGLTGSLMYYSALRIASIEQVEVEGDIMLSVACFGLVCNLLMVKILHGNSDDHFHCHSHSHNHDHKHHKHHHHKSHSKSHKKHDHDHGEEHECLRQPFDEEGCTDFNSEMNHREAHCEEIHSPNVHKEQHSHAKTSSQKKSKSLFNIIDSDNLNVRVTLVHILGDILQSIGVIIASAMIWISPEKFKIADPIMTFVFAGIALFTTTRVVKDCVLVLMEGAPREINIKAFEQKLMKIDSVKEIKNLHVWSVSSNQILMTAHIYTDGDSEEILGQAQHICQKYGINNSTIQIERIRDLL